MASVLSHAVAALSLGTCFYRSNMPKRVWVAGAICSVLPDIDVIGFRFGIRYGDFWGHRGFTHSLFFAAILAAIVTILVSRRAPLVHSEGTQRTAPSPPTSAGACAPGSGFEPGSTLWLWTYLFLATASHGLLDALTDGGLGVAFLSPFNNNRYFFPWRPIRVSPIGLSRFFSERGLEVLSSELLWIWLPSAVLAALAGSWRRHATHA